MNEYRKKMKVEIKLKLNNLSQRKTCVWDHSGFLINFPYNWYVYSTCQRSSVTSLL